jgi:hypothetical protein
LSEVEGLGIGPGLFALLIVGVVLAVLIIFGASMTNIFAGDFSNVPFVIVAIFAVIPVTVIALAAMRDRCGDLMEAEKYKCPQTAPSFES